MNVERLNNFRRSLLIDDMLDVSSRCDRNCFGPFLEVGARPTAHLIHHGASPETAEGMAQGTLTVVWRKAGRFDLMRPTEDVAELTDQMLSTRRSRVPCELTYVAGLRVAC